jgi:hypothetical protein
MQLVKVSKSGGGGGGSGTVTSVGLSVPQPANPAFSVSNSPILTAGTIAISANGASNQFVDGTGALQNSVAFTNVGTALATLADPSAVRYIRINANNSVDAISLATLKAELGLLNGVQTTTLNNTTPLSFTNITGCILALEPNSTYVGRFAVSSGCTSSAGIQFNFTFPSGATMNAGIISSTTAATAQNMRWTSIVSGTNISSPALNTAASQVGFATFDIVITTSATSGNLTPAFASPSGGQTATIYNGATFIQLQKIS